ncbi:hypothetical protein IPG41_04365 [Candidatus Peregrinibacteria bacterium]|nr:MAG: hypothetical protein IPG41_04365 [Candidatus Peregrinibacteria bacterium]
MKKHFLAGLALLSLAACNTPAPVTEPQSSNENEVIETQENENRYSQTIDFLEVAETLSVPEMVEGNRAYYENAAPDHWTEGAGSYPEHMKLYLHAWKTGTFREETPYAGQSLVLVQQDCEGPCSGVFFRYAVDEASDTWTLLVPYSTEVGGTWWLGGPTDFSDKTIRIPELEVPKQLEAYEKDSVVLLDAHARLSADRFPEDSTIPSLEGLEKLSYFKDTSFQTYYKSAGCIYGMAPDGVLARYSLMPDDFVGYDKEGNYDPGSILAQELTFTDTKGASQDKSFSLSAGGCGLLSACLLTFELTADEEARLQEVGTLNGRPVYLPTSVGPRPELSNNPSLDWRLYATFDNYLMAQAYDLENPSEMEATIEDYLAGNDSFLLKLDNGEYVLVNNSQYAPAAECGKPVIYLYPQKDTLVNVQVGIDEFTKTIPTYGKKGWTVLARPNGLLTNLADRLNYPYLFWEGNSSETIDAGTTWTLAKNDVATRLPQALKNMGLNEQETADFMEFWQPLLEAEEQPYIEFAFVGNAAMDQIAPLTVTPAPDQVIRLFMYYRGAEAAGLDMPVYKPAARYGFTVVEWGGSLY